MAEYGAVSQVINPGETVSFTLDIDPCRMGLIRHRQGSGSFLLSGWLPGRRMCACGCGCMNGRNSANYECSFGANIAIATGGTVAPISLAITIDGATQPTSVMTVTPAAVGEFFNVSRDMTLSIFANCCETVSVRNVSDQPIQLDNGTITFSRNDIGRRVCR